MFQGIDLFAGAGGLSIGAQSAGVKVRVAVESDPFAATTYAYNHRSVALVQRDIRTVCVSDISVHLRTNDPVIAFGGPPCQGFSTSNQKSRNRNNSNNWLFREYLRLVRAIRPDWIVFENVRGLAETEAGFFLDAVVSGLERIGYSTSTFVLDAADFGVPQTRKRLFIVGSLHGVSINAPHPTANSPVTVREAIRDLPSLRNGDMADERCYRPGRPSNYARQLRGALNSCHNHLVTRNADSIVRRFRHIPQGGNWEDIPRRFMKNYSDVERCHTGIYRRLNAQLPSVVIGNYRKNMLVHPWEDRGLSVREAARLQSFPDGFRFFGSIGFQQQQVGNAVPPLVAKAVFTEIFRGW
ncbi:MAG: DNA cytosine methyltransferase [Burkholderiales bacterium]|nr:DNA cytosine methyltransferase [Burkholderiales bacterium]